MPSHPPVGHESYCEESNEEGGSVLAFKYRGHGEQPVDVTVAPKKFKNKIYRLEDAFAMQRLFQDHQLVVLEAEMGAGKSSILRSLCSCYEPEEILYILGHTFSSRPNAIDLLREKLAAVKPNTRVLIVDSADYLYQSKKYARTGKKGYEERSRAAIEILQQFMAAHPTVKVVMTTHDDNWNFVRADANLKQDFDRIFREPESSAIYHPVETVNKVTLVRYLQHEEKFTRDQSWFLANLPEHPESLEAVKGIGPAVKENLYRAVLSQPKTFGHIFKKFPSLKTQFQEAFGDSERESDFIKTFVRAAITVDYQTTFLPILTRERGARRKEIWGALQPLDGTIQDESIEEVEE